jgi:predicted RNA binding protein YcfA (HicA-like mRNA interferase family)
VQLFCRAEQLQIGFCFYRQGKGSHELRVRDEDGRVIAVPRNEGRAIRKGTLRAIIRQTGLSVDEFMRL